MIINLLKIKEIVISKSVNEWFIQYKTKIDEYNKLLNEFHKVVTDEILESMIVNNDSESSEYSFLYDYAEKYGRECNEEEYKQYSNEFTSAIYYIHGYYFHMMFGQEFAFEIIKALNTFEIEFVEITGMTVAEDIATTKKNITFNE